MRVCAKIPTYTHPLEPQVKGKTVRKGNHESSSKRMEHAILLSVIAEIEPILREHGVGMEIAIDGDLSSKDTLEKVRTCFIKLHL